DEERVRVRSPAAVLLVGEHTQFAGDHRFAPVGEILLPAGYPVVYELRDGRVVADDDEDSRGPSPGGGSSSPLLVSLLVVPVKTEQGPFELLRQDRVAGRCCRGSAFLRQLGSYTEPQVPIRGHDASHLVVRNRYTWNLDDARFDGIDEAEVGHNPWKQSALRVPRAAEKERRG